ncbi:MAG: hypothetical protein ABI615_00075 [Chthoniobacterales bacterium]
MSKYSPSLRDRLLATFHRRGWRGFHPLYRFAGKPSIFIRTIYGSIMGLHPIDYIDGIVLREGYYESEVFEALLPYLRKGAVFWDIGANFGLHSLTAKHCAPDLIVHAFEPNITIFQRITANIAANDIVI